MKCIKMWLNHQELVKVSRSYSICFQQEGYLICTHVLRCFLFNMFISDLKEVTKCTLKYFADTKLGGPVNTIKDRPASQRDLGKMEE